MAERLKDRFFQRPFFERLVREIRAIHPGFDRDLFFERLYDRGWEQRELKARMRHASEALGQTLPRDYRRALAILLTIEGRFESFDHLLFADFVERFGVDDYEPSMRALEVLTRTTAEFAVRPFIRAYPEKALAQMLAWASHPDEKVRRLASEGCRPRLPWGGALEELKRDPAPILPILEALKDDPSESVRRSVANNLGDIAKDHPEIAIATGARWIAEAPARTPWVKHALRDLLKKGHRRALGLFGVGAGADVRIERLTVLPKRVPLGGSATLRVVLRSTGRRAQRLRLEYAMAYARPGGRTGRKVFKIAEVDVAPRARVDLSRTISFADRSVRTHHAGAHAATLIINGRRLDTVRFVLAAPAPRAATPARRPGARSR